jgi:hypothetical protein
MELHTIHSPCPSAISLHGSSVGKTQFLLQRVRRSFGDWHPISLTLGVAVVETDQFSSPFNWRALKLALSYSTTSVVKKLIHFGLSFCPLLFEMKSSGNNVTCYCLLERNSWQNRGLCYTALRLATVVLKMRQVCQCVEALCILPSLLLEVKSGRDWGNHHWANHEECWSKTTGLRH